MTAEPIEIPVHPMLYTVDDLFTLFPDDRRIELLEGALIVSPSPRGRHQVVSDELRARLRDAAPDGMWAVTAFNVRPDPDEETLFMPDVVVTTADLVAADPKLLEATQVVAVVEVVSPSSRSHDRLVKPAQYAAAGIPCYWRVELEPFPGHDGDAFPVIVVHELDGSGVYREAARLTAGVVGRTDLPFALELDPADLLRQVR